jgi:nocturnin
MFYRQDQLTQLEIENVTLKNSSDELTNQVSIFAKFRVNGHANKEFCVSVVHLKAKNGYEDLRHQQGQDLLKFLAKKVGSLPLVVCGDFNADFKEPVYRDFVNSNLESTYTNLSPERNEPLYTYWKVLAGWDSEGVHRESCKTIDYIWHSKDKIRVKAVLEIPTPELLGDARLPSPKYPSDHLSLVCDLCLLD